VWYLPLPFESTNCEPPTDVHASTKTTMHSGASRSRSSGNVGRNGRRLRHIPSSPV
jgi:hypothetical protein